MGKVPSGVLCFSEVDFLKFFPAEQGAFHGNDFRRNGVGCGQSVPERQASCQACHDGAAVAVTGADGICDMGNRKGWNVNERSIQR